MINILIKNEENQFKSLEVKGHSNSAPSGSDLICAAVSAIITGGFNAMKNPKNFKFELKEGYASMEALSQVSSEDKVVIETIITQLKTVEEGNKHFVQIKIS